MPPGFVETPGISEWMMVKTEFWNAELGFVSGAVEVACL